MSNDKTNHDNEIPEDQEPEIILPDPTLVSSSGQDVGKPGKRRPFFPYPGSKWTMLPKVLPLFPDHVQFISPFGGSGAEILGKPPSKVEIFNDKDGEIANLFRVVQDDVLYDCLRRKIVVPACREFYEEAIKILAGPITDRVASAAAFLIVAYQGWATAHPDLKRLTGWRVLMEPEYAKRWLTLPDTLALVRQRLVGVQVEDNDWYPVVRKCDGPSAFFFLDPPYFPGTFDYDLYAEMMSEGEHRAMLAALNRLEGRAMLFGYDNPVYARELADWHRIEIPAVAKLDVQGSRDERTEVVWMNYDPQATKLWLP